MSGSENRAGHYLPGSCICSGRMPIRQSGWTRVENSGFRSLCSASQSALARRLAAAPDVPDEVTARDPTTCPSRGGRCSPESLRRSAVSETLNCSTAPGYAQGQHCPTPLQPAPFSSQP
jgi:hypothetical protein